MDPPDDMSETTVCLTNTTLDEVTNFMNWSFKREKIIYPDSEYSNYVYECRCLGKIYPFEFQVCIWQDTTPGKFYLELRRVVNENFNISSADNIMFTNMFENLCDGINTYVRTIGRS